MGNAIARVWGGGDSDKPDPVTGLSKRDISNIQQSWAPLWEDAEKIGSQLYLSVFLADPESKKHFKHWKHLTAEELSNSQECRCHAETFLATINLMIDHLDDQEEAKMKQQKIFVKKPYTSPEFYVTLDQALLDLLRDQIKLSKGIHKSWTKFMNFRHNRIFKAIPEDTNK